MFKVVPVEPLFTLSRSEKLKKDFDVILTSNDIVYTWALKYPNRDQIWANLYPMQVPGAFNSLIFTPKPLWLSFWNPERSL